jgi:hypothetical protein
MKKYEVNIFDVDGKERMAQLKTDKSNTLYLHKHDRTLIFMGETVENGVIIANFKQADLYRTRK